MKNENQTQTCENCKYYKRYYVLSSSLRFLPTNEGHCGKYEVKKTIDIRKNKSCLMWQPLELLKLEQKYKIEETLIRMNSNIEIILTLLRDGE